MNYIDLSHLEYLGHGKNGRVYLMPNGKVFKICKAEKTCKQEYEVLKVAEGSRFFPKAYERLGRAMVREYVGGENLKIYIKKHGLSKKLALNLIDLIEEFKRLGFRRLDIRGEHIYILQDETVKVIDPAGQIIKRASYPRSMLKDLRRLKVLNRFYEILREVRPDLYRKWKR